MNIEEFHQPSDVEIDSIVQCCNGDLRLAVNLLEVASLGGCRNEDKRRIRKSGCPNINEHYRLETVLCDFLLM